MVWPMGPVEEHPVKKINIDNTQKACFIAVSIPYLGEKAKTGT